METKSAKQKLAYELIYPAILGSIVYDILPIDDKPEYYINLIIGVFFCFDCYHLFFFMEKKFDRIQRDTWRYVVFDIFVAILFWIGARHIFETDLFYSPLIAIAIVPFCFLNYSKELKYNVLFYRSYAWANLGLAIITLIFNHYKIGNYVIEFISISTLTYVLYVLTRNQDKSPNNSLHVIASSEP